MLSDLFFRSFFLVTARVGGGVSQPGGQGSNVYVLRVEPKEHKRFRPGTRLGESVTGVTEKFSMRQMFMCLSGPIVLAKITELMGEITETLECRKWGFKRWGLKEIRGYLRKKAFFLRFLDFPGALRTLRKRAKKAEKGRKGPISADFREGRPDTP